MAAISLVWYCYEALPYLHETEFDDAFMFVRYAKHWLSGTGYSWNSLDGPAYGITSPAHLLLVTLVLRFSTLPDPMVLTSISFSAGLLWVVALIVLGFMYFKRISAGWLPLLVIPCLILNPLFKYHSSSGMETTLSASVLTIFILCSLRFVEQQRPASFALCLGAAYLCYLARPDTGFYAILLPPGLLLAKYIHEWKKACLYILLLCVMLVLDLFIKKHLFGDYLPLPFYIKSAGFYRGYVGTYKWNAAQGTLDFLRSALPFLVVSIFFFSRRALPTVLAILLPMLLTFGYFTTIVQIMGFNARYYYPSIVFVILATFVIGEYFFQDKINTLARDVRPHRLRLALILAAILVLFLPSVENISVAWWEKQVIGEIKPYTAQTQHKVHTDIPLPTLEWWSSIQSMVSLLQNAPPSITIAASEIGYMGASRPDITIIDLSGLNDRYIAHNGFSEAYLFSRQPDLIWLPHPDYTYETSIILDSKIFKTNYNYYPGIFVYGIAILQNSEYSEQITRMLEREFAQAYPGYILSDYKAEPIE